MIKLAIFFHRENCFVWFFEGIMWVVYLLFKKKAIFPSLFSSIEMENLGAIGNFYHLFTWKV